MSDAVARRVPDGEMANAESGDLCARMMFVRVKVVVENRRTSPVAGCCGALGGDVDAEADVEGDGMGEGYARYEFSAFGESAHIAERTKQVRNVVDTQIALYIYRLDWVRFR